MAIAFDAAATNVAYSTTSTHTCSGLNRLLLVTINQDENNDIITNVTYNSVAMTRLTARQGDVVGHWIYLYALLAPTTGANTISISHSGTGNFYIESASYTGVRQSDLPDASGNDLQASISSPYSVSLTTVAEQTWRYWGVRSASSAITASTNATQRTAQFGTIKAFDSNSSISPAGAFSMSVTFSGTDSVFSVTASFAPAETTFFPDPSPETTSVDGRVFIDRSSGLSWASGHDLGTGDGASDNAVSMDARADLNNGGGAGITISRIFALFDTSSLPDGDTISSAILSLFGKSKTDGQSDSVGIVSSSPASNTALSTADYDAFTVHSDTAFSTKTIASISTVAYNDFTLDSSGIAQISKTGITKFGARTGIDYNETSSHLNPPNSNQNFANFATADTTGTANDPKLVVVHNPAAAADEPAIFFGSNF